MPFVEKHEPAALDSLLPRADFVITTTPHTPETEGMWHKDRFALMKNGRRILLTSDAVRRQNSLILLRHLKAGDIAGCGLDVFEIEPLPADSRLMAVA